MRPHDVRRAVLDGSCSASPIAHIGVQLTTRPLAAGSMRTMTRMARRADVLGDGEFVPPSTASAPCLEPGQADSAVAVQPGRTATSSTASTCEITWSFAWAKASNALLGKKCLLARIALVMKASR